MPFIVIILMLLLYYYVLIFAMLFSGDYDKKSNFLIDLIPFRRIFSKMIRSYRKLK